MPDSWTEKKKKRKLLQLALLLPALFIVAGVFIRNNFEVFSPQEQPYAEVGDRNEGSESQADSAMPGGGSAALRDEMPIIGVEDIATDPSAAIEVVPVEEAVFWVDVPTVRCKLPGNDDVALDIALRLIYDKKTMEHELLFKREDIKVIVQRVVARHQLAEIVVEKLRSELTREINGILKKGDLTDLEFLKFEPVL